MAWVTGRLAVLALVLAGAATTARAQQSPARAPAARTPKAGASAPSTRPAVTRPAAPRPADTRPADTRPAATSPADQVVADFDRVKPTITVPRSVRVEKALDRFGNAALHVTAPQGAPPLLVHLSDKADPANSSGFAFKVRTPDPTGKGGAGKTSPLRLRWLALDEKGRVIRQRRVDLQAIAAQAGQDVTVPWLQWRWGNSTGGAPGEIRKVGVAVESPATAVQLDDLRLVALPAKPASPADWLRRLAFAERDVRMAEGDGLLVATDAKEGLSDADLAEILSRMRKGRAFVRRVFGDAVRPLGGPGETPAALLIFRERADYAGFFERLGKAWAVDIAAPSGQGYTVQDVAGSTFDPAQGAGRPVYLHESMHAVLAHDVRLLTHSDHQSWLHEGLAAYVQLCVYPKSADVKSIGANFTKPVPADGSGFFQPLGRLTGRHVTPRHYAQLATLVAFLLEEKPHWLPVLAKELGEGRRAEDAFQKCGTTVVELEAAWMKWGKDRFAGAGAELPVFAMPKEFEADSAPEK